MSEGIPAIDRVAYGYRDEWMEGSPFGARVGYIQRGEQERGRAGRRDLPSLDSSLESQRMET